MKIVKAIRRGIASLRSNYLAVMSVLIMLLVVLVVYWQDFSILAKEAMQNEAVSHIILVPVLACFLAYRKKESAKASIAIGRLKGKTGAIPLSEIMGIALCLSAFLLYWYGSYTFYPLEYHVASLTIFVIGMTLILFNVKTLMTLISSILFLLFLMPPPSDVVFSAGAALGNFSTQASYTLLKIVGVPVTLSSEYGAPTLVINYPSGQPLEFTVDLPCSGIYSLVAFTMFATFLVCIVRGSTIKKIVLFPLGFLMLSILNLLRISLIVFIAYRFGEAIAINIFHLFSGWVLMFIGVLLLIIIAQRLLHLQIFGGTNKTQSFHDCDGKLKSNEIFCSTCGKFRKNHQTRLPKKFWIKASALLLASYLVTLSMQAPAFVLAQGLTMTSPNPEASVEAFPQISDYKLDFLYRDLNFERISRQDASLVYAYIPRNIPENVTENTLPYNPTVYVDVGVAGSITTLHSWEVCLVTFQQAQGKWPLVNVLESRDIQIMENPPIIARYFVFQHWANYTQVSLYWFQKALFKTELTIESKYTRISLIILTRRPEDIPKLRQKLLDMGKFIAAYWQPLKVQSLVSLGIPTMQALLGSTILFAIILQTAHYARKLREKRNNLRIFERFASPNEKLIFQSLKNLYEKTKITTTDALTSAIQKTTGNVTKGDELGKTLERLEEYKLVQRDIANVKDELFLVWKP